MPKKTIKKTIAASFICAALALPFAATAENYWWNPAAAAADISDTTSGNWKTGTNPSSTLTESDNQPGSSDNAYLVGANGATSVLALGSDKSFNVTDFGVAYGWNNTVTFTNAGTITATGTTTLGYWGGVASVTQTGGTWTNHKLVMGASADRQATIAELNLLGGSFIITNSDSDPAASIGANDFNGHESRLTINIDGGNLESNASSTKFFQLGNAAGSTGTVNQVSGTATFGGLNIGNNGTGYYNISGGTLTLTANSGYDHNIGSVAGGYGELNVSGNGEVFADKTLVIGKNGEGHLNISGGAVTVKGFAMGSGQSGVARVYQTGGDVVVSNVQNIIIGAGDYSTSEYVLEGGSFTFDPRDSEGNYIANNYFNFGNKNLSTNVMTIAGGTMTVNSPRYGLQLSGHSTVNLNGGTLAIYKTQRDGSTATDELAINFNGGEILALSDTAPLIGTSDVLKLNVLEGGAIFNIPEEQTRDIYQPFVSGVEDGKTDGGFTKRGKGVLRLNALPQWNGVTRVEEGQFEFRGSGVVGGTITNAIAIAEAGKWYNVNKDTHDLTAIGTWENEFKITDYTQNSRKTLDRFCVEGGSVKLSDGTFEATNLVLTTGAVLDLNGGTMTIKNLSGEGEVTNGTVVFIGGGEITPTGTVVLPGGTTLKGTLNAEVAEGGELVGSIASDGALELAAVDLVVTGAENFDNKRKTYTLVMGAFVSGSFGTVTGLPDNNCWGARVRSTSAVISYSAGFMLIVR